MPPIRGWDSRGREPPAFDHDLTRLVAHSSSLSCCRASEGTGLHAAAVIGHWRLSLKARRSQCPRWYMVDHRQAGDRAPNGIDGLAFRRCTVEGDSLPSWGHRRYGRDFL